MSETALIKRPVGDDLAVKVEAFKNEQLAEIEKRAAPLKREVFIESFLLLAERYFGVNREFIKNLSKEERAELLKNVFEEAKRRLLWQSPLIHTMLALTVIGSFKIFTIHNDQKPSFPAFRIRRLYDWYMENYGADDLEKAMKSGDFDKKTNLLPARPDKSNSIQEIKKPEPYEIILPALAEGVLEASEKAVESIDFSPAMLLEIQLSKLLKDRGIRIFKYDDVKNYLYSLARGLNMDWHWRALREKDVTERWVYNGYYDSPYSYGYYSSKNWNCRPYSKLIPPRVRIIVEEIAKEFGDKVRFLVSYHTDQPSVHFIAADALDVNMLIFGLWHDDELKQPSE